MLHVQYMYNVCTCIYMYMYGVYKWISMLNVLYMYYIQCTCGCVLVHVCYFIVQAYMYMYYIHYYTVYMYYIHYYTVYMYYIHYYTVYMYYIHYYTVYMYTVLVCMLFLSLFCVSCNLTRGLLFILAKKSIPWKCVFGSIGI